MRKLNALQLRAIKCRGGWLKTNIDGRYSNDIFDYAKKHGVKLQMSDITNLQQAMNGRSIKPSDEWLIKLAEDALKDKQARG